MLSGGRRRGGWGARVKEERGGNLSFFLSFCLSACVSFFFWHLRKNERHSASSSEAKVIVLLQLVTEHSVLWLTRVSCPSGPEGARRKKKKERNPKEP